jgi:hypothetical protein
MSIINRPSGIVSILLFLLTAAAGYTGRAQSAGEDPIGFKGGYKALSRLCETNLDGAARLLANDYSRGYFVSLEIPAGADTVTDIAFLTATPPEMVRQIAWALKGTNGQWMKRARDRRLLIPIFFCQNTPPNDTLFSQLLVTNNVGFNVPGFPDQWPEAAEGVWIHPICPMVAGHAPGAPSTTAATTPPVPPAPAPPSTSAAATTAPPPAAPGKAAAPATANPATAAAPTYPAAPSTTAAAVPDSTNNSGIYRTRADFDAGMMTYPSAFLLEDKTLLSWAPIDYSSYSATVRIRTSPNNKDYQEFPFGSIFGFRSGNVTYVYLKSGKEYLSLLYKGSPFYLFMDAQKRNGYNGNVDLYGVFMYAKTLDGPLKELTRKRIDEEFGSNPQMAADLQVLRKELDRHSAAMSRGDFETCKQLAARYLSKYAQ